MPAPLRPPATGRILVASSSSQQRAQLRTALEFEGHHVAEAESVGEATQGASSRLHDVVVADSCLGGIGLSELCRTVRATSELGIIVLASDDNIQGRIDLLNAGADDFVPVPFVWAELLARVRAILRRVRRSSEGRQIVLQDREVDLKSYEIKGPGNRVSHLTPKEFLVLQQLVAHANQPRTPQTLAQTIWQRDGIGDVEYVRIVIRQLRQKIEPNPDNPRYILTERSVGYRFQMPPAYQNDNPAMARLECSEASPDPVQSSSAID
jgi:two-component system KDP operon response regulator KdpE